MNKYNSLVDEDKEKQKEEVRKKITKRRGRKRLGGKYDKVLND